GCAARRSPESPRAGGKLRLTSAVMQKWIVPVGVVAAWEVCGRGAILPPYLSYPSNIVAALWEVTADGELLRAVTASLYRVIAGFAIGTAAGMFVGLGAGLVPAVRNFFDPLVSFLFAVPKIAFLPVFLLLFGIGHTSKIAIIAFSCFFPVFIASSHAVMTIDRLFVWA